MTRQQISDILREIAPPGKKREVKIETIAKLKMKNSQNHPLELTLESYPEF